MKILEQKNDISIHYENMIYSCLSYCIRKINTRHIHDNVIHFVCLYISFIFYRIPKLRDMVLDIIDKDNSNIMNNNDIIPTINEIDEYIKSQLSDNDTRISREWDNDFYVYIKDEKAHDNNLKILADIMNDNIWRYVCDSRNQYKRRIIYEWMKYTYKEYIDKKGLSWYVIPGYSIMIRAYILDILYIDTPYINDITAYTCKYVTINTDIIMYILLMLYRNMYLCIDVVCTMHRMYTRSIR